MKSCNLDEEKIKRAIELTEGKYCSTLATLRVAVEISSQVEIVPAEDN